MKINIEKIKNEIAPVIARLGYELVDVKWSKNYGNDTLTVYIYKKGDMSLADCESVHNAIDPVIDAVNPTGDAGYNLDVSSMGLDWNMKTDADFNRRLGEEIEISFYQKTDGKKKLTGVLESFDGETITLSLTDEKSGKGLDATANFERKAISKAVMAVRFE